MGKHKERYGKTRLGKFIEGIGKVVPDVAQAGIKLATGDIKGALAEVGDVLKSNEQKSAEAKAALIEFEKYKFEFAQECFELEVRDRESAREMFGNGDNKLQKTFSIVFLIGYVLITGVFLYGVWMFAVHKVKLDNYLVSMVTAIFTAMSSKVNTIVDFFFGGSVKQE
jgi:hypothetical protein